MQFIHLHGKVVTDSYMTTLQLLGYNGRLNGVAASPIIGPGNPIATHYF